MRDAPSPSDANQASSQHRLKAQIRGPKAKLAILAAAAHGVLLLSDGVYWDSWLIQGRLREDDFAGLAYFYSEVGMPEYAGLHWLLAKLTFPFGHRLAAFTCAVLIPLLVHDVFLAATQGRKQTSFWAGVFVAVSPSLWTPVAEPSITTYYLFLTCFLAGVAIYLRAPQVDGHLAWPRAATGLTLMLASYPFKALIVFSIIPALLAAGQHSRHREVHTTPLRGWNWYVVSPCLTAVAFYFAHKTIAPPHGMFAAYNTPSFSLSAGGIVTYFIRHLQYSLVSYPDAAIRSAMQSPVEIIAVGVAFASLAGQPTTREARSSRLLAYVGTAALMAGAFPYAALNKAPNMVVGWETRHSILTSLAMAAITVALSEGIAEPTRNWLRAFWAAMCFSFVFSNHLALQARHVKSIALSRELGLLQEGHSTGFILNDSWPLWSNQPYIAEELAALRYLSSQRMDSLILDARQESLAALDFRSLSLHWQRRYHLADVRCPMQWRSLHLTRGQHDYSPSEIAVRYWAYRFLWPGRMPDFIAKLLRVDVGEPQENPSVYEQCLAATSGAKKNNNH